MDESIYIHYSDLITTPVLTERGYLQLSGYHAMGGFKAVSLPFSTETPFDLISPGEWLRKLARFWSALAYGVNSNGGSFQTSFELRVHRTTDPEAPLDVSLWVKTFTREELQAAMVVESLVETIGLIYPLPARLEAIQNEMDFKRFWGDQDLQWLAEVRRPVFRRKIQPLDEEKSHIIHNADWSISLAGWMESWNLLSRLPGELWMSVGICPTVLFDYEAGEFQEREELARDADEMQFWTARKNRLLTRAYLLRLRIGGDIQLTQVMTRAMASALTDVLENDAFSDESPRFSVCGAEILAPGSILDWDKARFNWQWGDFQDWGDGCSEPAFSAYLSRLPYLADTRETALLAGLWS